MRNRENQPQEPPKNPSPPRGRTSIYITTASEDVHGGWSPVDRTDGPRNIFPEQPTVPPMPKVKQPKAELNVNETLRPGYARVDVDMSNKEYRITIRIEKRDAKDKGIPKEILTAASAMFEALNSLER